ncbi:Fe2+-enterobactin ABC transporter substrate-binding protein [Rhodobacter sp. TJ_12]|uniref:Fe2+-enterobactin ABC transporter substrate-binding protein n=1 Tax=Rhodobacter sp. TJ_12 TaxID=2029399 RepID=UPI001CBBEA09|nr:Fe2+-enterobactin ABC transporter substrate-binding protein [Rhodobacter sp. TJ_12]MBZ4023721.1 Fe2+-enterobactin ABC transporter substrate-binding protein [Rhodobacter sp. TJ_12]
MNRRRFLIASLCASAWPGLPARAGAAEGWPRRLANADGSETELTAPPARVLSSSVTLSGSLLAIGAPLIASATTTHGDFFAQWQAVAENRGVEKLWPAGSVDLEAVWALAPDLIVVSTSGADSALAYRDALAEVAPVLVLDYGALDWQELSRQLGRAIGHETAVEALLSGFTQELQAKRARLVLPAGRANIVSYHGAGAPNPIATATGAHGQLLAQLGFRLEDPPKSWQAAGLPASADFVRAAYEHLTLLEAETTFLLSGTEADVARFCADPILANLPSVRSGQVYGLGPNSFRIDYYSAQEIVAGIAAQFDGA